MPHAVPAVRCIIAPRDVTYKLMYSVCCDFTLTGPLTDELTFLKTSVSRLYLL